MAIEIFTFGDFNIIVDGHSVLKRRKRANKNLELLKYFITHHGKKLVAERIVEDIWPIADLSDPKNVLRTQIYRLRKKIKNVSSKMNRNNSNNFNIVFENGFYIFDPGDGCIFDFDRFEDFIDRADRMRKDEPDKAIEIYKEIIDIYNGEYLAENLYSEWIYTTRNRYHRLFIQSVLRLMELLENKGLYIEIIEIYERVIDYAPLEESLHIYFLEALLALKEYKNALSHYNYITGKLYREMSVSPTSALKSIYRRITSHGENHSENDLTQISLKMADDDTMDGALFCEIDYFRTIYNLERRRTLRSGNRKFLGLISIMKNDKYDRYEEALKTLQVVLLKYLRKGDVFSRWGLYQMVVLLSNVSEDNLPLICERIEKKFRDEMHSEEISIRISCQPVGSKESFFK